MNIEFASTGERKEILKLLKEEYGILKFNYLIAKSGKEKLRIFSGILSREEIITLSRILHIDSIGLYFGFFKDGELRLSMDACHLLQPEKNVLEISDSEAEIWMKGQDLEVSEKERVEKIKKGFIIIKNQGNFLGAGKLTETKILNFVPEERRRK